MGVKERQGVWAKNPRNGKWQVLAPVNSTWIIGTVCAVTITRRNGEKEAHRCKCISKPFIARFEPFRGELVAYHASVEDYGIVPDD